MLLLYALIAMQHLLINSLCLAPLLHRATVHGGITCPQLTLKAVIKQLSPDEA